MVVAEATIGRMAKKKPDPKKKPNRAPSVTIYVRAKPRLGKALEDYINSLRPRPSTTAVIETALEDFLAAKGFWSPLPDGADFGQDDD